ncbi:MAG: FlgD immunoglobulin-like domain containing protein [Calditrichia bacterium]
MKNIRNKPILFLRIIILLLFSLVLFTDFLPAQERPEITLLPGYSAEYFYRNVPRPDGIAVRTDDTLLIVNEIDPTGVFVASRGDQFNINGRYCETGPPFNSPDDILQYHGDSVFVVDGQAQTLFLVFPGGSPIPFVTSEDITIENQFNPFGIALAPSSFDGDSVDPGDLIIADIAFGWPDEKAIWAINPVTGDEKVLARGNIFEHGPYQVAFSPDGILYMIESDASGTEDTRIVTIDADGTVTPFLTGIPSTGNLAVHPVTGEVFFGVYELGEIRRISPSHGNLLYPSTSEVFASGFEEFQDFQFSPDGEVLYVSAFFPSSNDIIAIRKTHTFMVTTYNDDGAGSLRAVIDSANAKPGLDSIHFNIPGTGPHTIQLSSQLPQITDPVTIDGYTQSGASPATSTTNAVLMVEIDGQYTDVCLDITSGESTIRGLTINRCSAAGISLYIGGGNIIEGNFLGTNISGTAGLGNYRGILIIASSGNTIGGTTPESRNIISGNSYRGISLGEGTGNVITGNYIGTNAAGTEPVPNGNIGLLILSADSTVVGEADSGARNVISGNDGNGIIISNSTNSRIIGNFIGTDPSGTIQIANQIGITISAASDNIIGGSSPETRNVISGNSDDGINILGSTSENNGITGNFIGVAADGSTALGNGDNGIYIESPNNIIGGPADFMNVISGNASYGIVIAGTDAAGNRIAGNYIGTDASGTTDLGNSQGGIYIGNGASDNIIGGTTPEARNIISANGENPPPVQPGPVHGIVMDGVGSNGNIISGNYIGTDVTGEVALGNGGDGIHVRNGASDNTVEGNVISGNETTAISIFGDGTENNFVCRNLIGLDAAGTANIGQPAGTGVYIGMSASNNHIGGASPDSGNFITGSGWAGFYTDSSGATNNKIISNCFGTDINKQIDPTYANRIGILLCNASGYAIGGASEGEGNLIANCLNEGILLQDTSSYNLIAGNEIINNGTSGINVTNGTGNNIAANRISANGGLGIDLGGDGVTLNDEVDLDSGPNNLQNYPVLTSAASDVDLISVELHSTPGIEYRIEFFESDTCDTSGYGEGQTFIGNITVATDIYGDVTFNAYLPDEIKPGKFYTATATAPDNNTSEFSAAIASEIKTKSYGPHYVINRTHSGIPLHWPDGKATFDIGPDAQAFATSVEAGYATWSALPELEYIASGNAASSNQWAGDPDGLNNNVWIADWDTTGLAPDVVAATRVRYNAITGEMTDVDIGYNAQDFNWSTSGEADKLDVQNVATHEIGHFGGLGDIYNEADTDYWVEGMGDGNAEQTMYGLIKAEETKKRDLYQYSGSSPEGDVGGIEYIYANIPDERVDLMLVFDGSMNYADNYHAFEAAKKSAIQLIDKMREGDRIGIVKLPDTLLAPLTQIVDENSRTDIKDKISAMNVGGRAAIGSGLQTAQNQLVTEGSAQNKWAMILFSSGEETAEPYAESVLPDIIGTKTAIYTMGFANGPASGQNLNSHIADVTRGDYFLLADSSEIGDVVNFIWYRLLGMQIIYLSEAHSTSDLAGVSSPGLYWQGGMYWQGGFYWQGGMYWQGGFLEIGLYWQGSDLDLSILPPPADGETDRLIDSTNVDDYPNIKFFTGPNYEYYQIKNADPGTWSGWVFGESLPQIPETYRTYIAARTDVTMEVKIPSDRLPSGAHTEIDVKLYEGGERQSDLHLTGGQPILGAIVSADIVNPDGDTTFTEPFYESGDGLYTFATRPFPESGSYKIIINASKPEPSSGQRKLISRSVHSLYIYDLPSSDAVNEIRNVIFGLDNSYFKQPASNRKIAFSNKLDEVLFLIEDGNYDEAIDKLENDVLAKMDAFYGGSPGNDWIITEPGQHAIYPLVRNLIVSLQTLPPKKSETPALRGELSPKQFKVLPNFPNPFNLQTTIQYELPRESQVTLKIYNVLGQLVKTLVDDYQKSGYYTLRWNGDDESGTVVSNGVYIYRFKAGNYIKTGKMLLMK